MDAKNVKKYGCGLLGILFCFVPAICLATGAQEVSQIVQTPKALDYPIYTYGGGDLLISIFNAVGAIFKSDNTYLTPIGSTAMVLGGVYAGIKATFGGNISYFGRSWMIPSMIAFLVCFAPKSTVWIKDEVALNAPVKIDNIPVGIAFFTSFTSNIAHKVSLLLEENMLPADSPLASKTGILYGAKAIAKVRDVQIQDPILLRNTKEYLRQCYMKPYVMGNFGGHKSAAVKATDILAFLEANPVKGFGIKPMEEGGTMGPFETCKTAGTKIKAAIEAHSKDASMVKKFAASIGITTGDDGLMTRRIKSMTSDTLGYLEQGQRDIHEWMKQAMVLNANRESYDDWREKVGHSRIFPELVKMQATRGMFHQAFGSIVGGEMAESMIPAAAQPVMLALVVMCFVIILPLAMLPGGWQYIITGIKLMVWVCSWPVFYTIIHAIAMIQLKDAVGGWGEDGLSLIGQGGFTQLILWKYASVQSLITAVPFISFAIVFGSPYALSSIAGGVAATTSSAGIGANMADNNLSMDQVSYGNTTKYQRNEAPSMLMGGGVIDDGGMRVITDSGGSQIITEHQDQMATNYKTSESSMAQVGASLSSAQSTMASLSQRETETASIVDNESIDVARSIAQGTSKASNLSLSDTQALRQGFGMDESLSKTNSVVDGQSTGTSSNLGINVPGVITSITGLSGGTGTNASNNHEVREDMSESERIAFNQALDKVKSASLTDSIQTTNSEDMRHNKALSSALSSQQQIASDKAKTQQDIDTYSDQLSYLKSNAGTIDRNVNEQVMQSVMAKHPELHSKDQAARWIRSHRSEADAIARPIVDNYNPFNSPSYQSRVADIQENTKGIKNMDIATKSDLKDDYQEKAESLSNTMGSSNITSTINKPENILGNDTNSSNIVYNKDVGKMLHSNLNQEEQNVIEKLNSEREKSNGSTSAQVMDKVEEGIEKSESISGKSTVLRVIEDIGNTSGAVIENIGEKGNSVLEYLTPDKSEKKK